MTNADELFERFNAIQKDLPANPIVDELQDVFDDLTFALREARRDTERLDWLEDHSTYQGGGSGGTYSWSTPLDHEMGMMRAAIDAAMGGER